MSSWLLGVSVFFSSVSVYNGFGLRNKLRDGPLHNEKARGCFFSPYGCFRVIFGIFGELKTCSGVVEGAPKEKPPTSNMVGHVGHQSQCKCPLGGSTQQPATEFVSKGITEL